jgi:hypothetical protein
MISMGRTILEQSVCRFLNEESVCRFRKLLPVLNDFLIPPIDTVGVTTLELRPNTPATVEDIVSRIADLVLERQALRAGAADSVLIERNRLAIVRAHQDLSLALIQRHCAPKAETAEAAA